MSSLPADVRVVPQAAILVQELEGELILLNPASAEYISFEGMSLAIYQHLTSVPSIQAAAQAFLLEYPVDPAQLQTDIETFLAFLLQKDLVRLVD